MKRTPLPILIVWLWLSSLLVMGVANAATPLLTSPTAGTTFSGNSQTFTWDAQGNTVTNWTLYVGSKLGQYDYYRSAALAGGVTSVTVPNLPVNAHKVYARLRYKIGTVWALQDTTFYAAGTNHKPTITGTPATTVKVGSAYAFTPTASDDDGETISFSIVNKPVWATFNAKTGKLMGTPKATHIGTTSNISIRAKDERAGVTAMTTFSVQVVAPNTAPTITGTPATAVNVSEAYSFTPTASDADNDTLTFSITNPPAWATFDTATGKLSGTPTAAGTTTGVVISVTDGKSAPVSLPAFNIQVIQPNRAPTLSGTPATSVNVGTAYSFTPTASDADNDTLTFSITNPPAWATFGTATGKLSGTPTAAGTTTGVVISVTDGKSAPVSLPAFNIQVIQPNRAPTITGTPATSVNVGTAYSFTPTASDADNDTLTFSITNPPAWATFSTATGKLSGTPTAAGTTTGVVISVTDGKSAPVSLPAFNIQVIQPNRAPTITGTPATAVNVSETYSFTPTASDADNDTLTFSITNPPAWATFSTTTGKLSGTPSAAGTTTGVVISVTDGKSAPVSLPAFNIQVIQPNRAPTITGTLATAVNVSETYSFTPTASDADNDTLTFSITNPPAWATFDTATGKLSGTPTAAGTTTGIVISVTDGKSDPVSLPAFNITVSALTNLARQYGVATQSTTYTGYPAANAIDGNTATFNHTNTSTGGDWWQVKLPAIANISSIVIKNRDSSPNYGRLAGATVYVTTAPYSTNLSDADKVGTLSGIATNIINLSSVRKGSYVIVKAGSAYLHMAEVEVYGYGSAAPTFDQTAYSFDMSYKAAQGASVGATKAYDYQADPITYSIDGSVPFAIDAQGNITLSGALKQERYSFNVKVSDGANVTTVPVTVNAPINLAREFGVAVQGGTYSSTLVASRTIDGDSTTSNHTTCDANNWWQVALPNPTQLDKIVVKNNSTWQSRLNGAVVYVTDVPYTTAVPTDASKVATLTGASTDQITTFATPKTGAYVIVKNAGTECLHMAEVEVYGQAQATPVFSQSSYRFYVGHKSAQGTLVGAIKAVDYQLNTLSYSLVGTVPFAIDAQGNITLNGTLNPNLVQSYDFTVKASDGVNVAAVPVTVKLGKGNGVVLQRWNGIVGSTTDSFLNAAHYQDAPDFTEVRTTLDAPDIANDIYAQKLSAILVPTETNDYQFAIAGNYFVDLRLSTTPFVANVKSIAQKAAWTSYQAWTSGVQSAVVHLEAGKAYYIEALHIADNGSDHVSVAWKRSSDASYSLIPNSVLYQDAMSVGLVKPTFSTTALDLHVEPYTAANTVIGKAPASDPQGDTLTYSVVESVPFAVDAQGNLRLTQVLNHNLVRSYTFTVKVTDGVYEASLPVTVTVGKGAGVFLQRWEGISGSSIASLTSASHYKNDAPDYTASLTAFTVADSGKDNFGQRLTGVIKPTQSGRYQFAIVGDDNTQLRLSTNAVLDGAPIIAHQDSYGAYQDWTGAGVSGWITLDAGGVYAIEALHKEGGGADHVSVAWKREGDTAFSSLPTSILYQDAVSVGAVKPVFVAHSSSVLIKASTALATKVAQVRAVDPQGDALTYSLSGSNLFSIDAQGNISVAGALQSGTTYSLTISVTDGTYSISDTITVKTSSDTAINDAITSGDATNVTTDEVLDAAIAQAQTQIDSCKSALNSMYPSGLEATTFPSRSAYFNSTSARNIPFHAGITNGSTRVYSWIGQKDAGTRYAVLGTNVFSFATVNTATKNSTLNLIKWLMKQPNSTDILNQKLTILVPNSSDRSALATWFTTNGLTHQWTIASDTNLLNTGVFDLYLGDISNSLADMQKAFALGKPVLVFNNWYEPSATTLAEFELTWSWYGQGSVGNLASTTEQCIKTSVVDEIQTTLNSLKNGLPDFIYESGDCPVSDAGNTNCDVNLVTDAAGNSVATLFNDGASAIRSKLRALDDKGVNAFSLSSSENLWKLVVLLGDKYRDAVQFPMDKATTDDTTFYRAQFADFAVHYARPNNTYQPDMGKFTDAQVELNAQATISKTVSFTPTTLDQWTSTGLYAPPGKTITVRRTDTGTSVVKLKFNILRDGAVHVWQTNDYNRPRFLESSTLSLEVGKTYTLSTPRGGPVYVGWNAVASGATPFTLEISGVLDNPLLQAFDATSIQTFLSNVEATNSDWVDVKTPYAEIHSLKSNMLTAFAKQDGNSSNGYTTQDVQNYISDLNNYLIAGNYNYAGFTGVGLPALSAEVQAFCNTTGLNSVLYGGTNKNLCTDALINAKPNIQHVNSDVQAACGALCSGNPFDSGGAIMPLGWGENHEMGHNLQRERLKIYSGRSTEVSNNIFPLHTQWSWTVAQGLAKHPDQTSPSNQSAFSILQTAISAGTAASSSHPLWSGTGSYDNAFQRLAFFMQLAYTQQSWDMYTKMYLMERILTDAVKDTTGAKWDAVKGLLGMSAYSRTDANSLNGNDFMYLAAAKIAGKDYSNYFAAWGIEVSAAAKAQVAANGFTVQVPNLFYYVNNELPAVMPTLLDTIPLNGTSAWVDPTP